jgi:hypothetical protein
MVAVDTDLTIIEPSLTVTGDGLLVQSIVWVVRVLESDRIATYLVVDGSDAIYEMNPDNQAVQVGGTLSEASPTPAEQTIPGSVVGLEIIHVSDALAIRDSGADDRELAVQGWFTPAVGYLRCAAPPFPLTSPIQSYCGDSSMWLTQDAESLIHRSSDQTSSSEPRGPALRPDVDDLDLSWQPADLGIGANGDSTPTDVVFVGHFDDRRAALCPEAKQAACRDRFVVDSVTLVHGVPQARSDLHAGNATSTIAAIEAIVANQARESSILSMTAIDGQEGLTAIEPSLATGQDGLIGERLVWVVRVLKTDRIATYIVVDGSDRIYEMKPDNHAVQVGGTR